MKSFAVAAALALAATSANAQDNDNHANSNTSTGIDASQATGTTDNWAFTEEGKRLWACAVKAADAVAGKPSASNTQTTENIDGNKVYVNNTRIGDSYRGIDMGAVASFDPKDQTVLFTSYTVKTSALLNNFVDAAYSIKMKFNEQTDVVDVSLPDEKADAKSVNLVTKGAELAMLHFVQCGMTLVKNEP